MIIDISPTYLSFALTEICSIGGEIVSDLTVWKYADVIQRSKVNESSIEQKGCRMVLI